MRILVLGAGFGGLELSTRLSEEFGEELDIVLIDQSEGFVFGFSKLDVMFGRTSASPRSFIPTATRQARDCASSRRPSARSTRRPSTSRPTPALSTPTSWSSRWGRPRSVGHARGWWRAATSSTRWPGRSPSVTCCRAFAGGRVDRRRDLDAVQVPAGPERDRPAAARLPHRTGIRDESSHLAGHAARACPSRLRRRPPRRSWSPSPSVGSAGIPNGW